MDGDKRYGDYNYWYPLPQYTHTLNGFDTLLNLTHLLFGGTLSHYDVSMSLCLYASEVVA